MLTVDHASVRVDDLDRAAQRLEQWLGMIPTRTPGAEQRHSRLYLHRSYLEVSVGEGPPAGPELFFFRFPDLEAACARLKAAGLNYLSEPYHGRDGVWDNVEVEAPPGVPAPILVRRVSPAELAANWPPAREQPWPCGAVALAGFHLRVPQLAPAQHFFQTLLDAVADPPATDPRTGALRVGLRWEGGLLTLHQAGAPGIDALLLRTVDLDHTARFLAARGTAVRSLPDGLWVEQLLPGLTLGFTAQGA